MEQNKKREKKVNALKTDMKLRFKKNLITGDLKSTSIS